MPTSTKSKENKEFTSKLVLVFNIQIDNFIVISIASLFHYYFIYIFHVVNEINT